MYPFASDFHAEPNPAANKALWRDQLSKKLSQIFIEGCLMENPYTDCDVWM